MTSSHRFPPSARLHVSAQFQAAFGGGNRLSSAHFRLHARLLADGDDVRLGVTVSKRVDKHAVGRNRIRRQVKEVFRHVRMDLLPGDYVLLAKPDASKVDNAQLRSELLSLFARARTLKTMTAGGTMPPSDAFRPPSAT